jgi:hypothetical protein
LSQITHGIILGSPGSIGSPAIAILFGSGSPTSQTVDASQCNPVNCQIGSLYLDYLNGAMYLKTAVATWTQVTVP